MNYDNQRLREIQQYKIFYQKKIIDADSELEHDLIMIQLNKLRDEELEILERCDL